jgi:hypothetical protein|uniref:Zinc-ribbon containing domain protein n=2 Tax=unclassified Caudoviricetes TaxID=2788787 RepID=A0A8S5VFQ6_9CAUD|nr:MAG TPA: zinc-ribbon containing domain protein [Siphoviridae sp. ctu1o13]DAG05447.1 MAG TPA: zinc-ribbon containing domain protein [Siphoviridae sp. ct1da40]
MAEYIKREAAIAYIREQSEECQKAFEELGGESGIYADAYNDLAEDFYGIPAAKAVSLHDIYRVIAGHSYYHGDRILAALTCIGEGKEVNPVRPSDVATVVHGLWSDAGFGELPKHAPYGWACSVCGGISFNNEYIYCPNCGAKMDGGAE